MANGTNGRMHGPMWKVLDWLVPPALAVLAWSVVQILDTREDMAAMKGNRFTSQDGLRQLELIRTNGQLISAMQAQVAEFQAHQIRWLDHHEENLDELERMFERHLESTRPHKTESP